MHRENFEKKGMMENCELCNSLAKMYCESDQATLCWDCDSKVHGANFLVAKHSRTLLCHLCQYPTPWIGSGPKLSPTIYVCLICVNNGSGRVEKTNEGRNDDLGEEDDVAEGDDSNDDLNEDDNGDIEENGEENQVVPWSSRPVPLSSVLQPVKNHPPGSAATEQMLPNIEQPPLLLQIEKDAACFLQNKAMRIGPKHQPLLRH